MKIGLISDLHGDPVALELAWAHLTVLGADLILCAGDLVGYGPFPDRVVEFVQTHQIPCVRGNHDRWALERGPGVPDEFRGGLPSGDTLEFLSTLPFDRIVDAGGKVIVVVHGSISDDMEFVTRRKHPPRLIEGWLNDTRADILVVGHSHEPGVCETTAGLLVNPGSVVSSPYVKSSHTFGLIDLCGRPSVTFHDVETGGRVEPAPWSVDEPGV